MLSASTRNGATLQLRIGTLGYFSKKVLPINEKQYLIWENIQALKTENPLS
jgi:hypothetical protein